MDGFHFDRLTRSFAATLSRRRLPGLLGALTLGGPLVVVRLAETEAKRKKGNKRKKKKRNRDNAPPGGCPGGQKPCDGGCISSSQCCDNADCSIFGQVCLSRQCTCPAALPDICGGACLQPCTSSQARNPGTCVCCVRFLNPSGGDASNCCSERQVEQNGTMYCSARTAGEACQFDAQCVTQNCVQGTCSACYTSDDYCQSFDTCSGGAGRCLKAVDGTTRCGIPETGNEGDCGWCTRNFDCDQGVRPGAFCATNTGPNCGCAQGQTFCARPS